MKKTNKFLTTIFARRSRRRALARELREASLQAVQGNPDNILLYLSNYNKRSRAYNGPTTA